MDQPKVFFFFFFSVQFLAQQKRETKEKKTIFEIWLQRLKSEHNDIAIKGQDLIPN